MVDEVTGALLYSRGWYVGLTPRPEILINSEILVYPFLRKDLRDAATRISAR